MNTKTLRLLLAAALGAALASSPAAAQSDEARVKAARVLAMFSHEPTILATQEQASDHAMNNPGVYSSWLSRASAAAALPDKLSGRYIYILDDDLNLRTTELTGTRTETKANDIRNAIQIDVQWDLAKLVFNPEEYRAAEKIGKIVERREDLLLSVNKLYFSRRRLQAELALSPPDDVLSAVKIAALTADLDALTGGWFSNEVAVGLARRKLTAQRPAPAAGGASKGAIRTRGGLSDGTSPPPAASEGGDE